MNYAKYQFPVHPSKMLRLLIDTDMRNEADDPYAVAHALLSPRFDTLGIIAAHFGTRKQQDSMEASYAEVRKLLSVMHWPEDLAIKGAEKPLPDEFTPVHSEGAQRIIEAAMADSELPLYVLFLGPLTDMASALLLEPRIAGRLTCIWIGGDHYPSGGPEFNVMNDIAAANVVFRSTVPVWQVPRSTYQQVVVSLAELESRVRPCGQLGRYLFDQLVAYGQTPSALHTIRTGECWCLGDSPAVGLLLSEYGYTYDWIQAPEVGSRMEYIHTGRNRPIRVYHTVDSRFILEDLYAKLKLFAEKEADEQ